jgi:sarcosine oxidase subunit alpha
MLLGANAVGYYEGGIVGVEQGRNFIKVQARRIILTTGAAERMLAFENNDLPGVYGAGAVQTLMNVHRVLPGRRVLMIGSGNIGLIVSYQLLQAQVEVVAVLEAMPRIGGYLVHAAKLRRAGVPILTSHTIVRAVGEDCVSGAVMERIDDRWRSVPGTETEVQCDVICLAVGLTPLSDLLWQAGCEMKYVPELGGHVPVRDSCLRTSNPSVYIAGDVGGVEEASSAMIQGEIAGISAVMSLGLEKPGHRERLDILARDLQAIRSGPTGEKICRGMQCVTVLEGGAGDGGGR